MQARIHEETAPEQVQRPSPSFALRRHGLGLHHDMRGAPLDVLAMRAVGTRTPCAMLPLTCGSDTQSRPSLSHLQTRSEDSCIVRIPYDHVQLISLQGLLRIHVIPKQLGKRTGHWSAASISLFQGHLPRRVCHWRVVGMARATVSATGKKQQTMPGPPTQLPHAHFDACSAWRSSATCIATHPTPKTRPHNTRTNLMTRRTQTSHGLFLHINIRLGGKRRSQPPRPSSHSVILPRARRSDVLFHLDLHPETTPIKIQQSNRGSADSSIKRATRCEQIASLLPSLACGLLWLMRQLAGCSQNL